MLEYVCEFCGHAGRVQWTDDIDLVQCRDCGELVVSLDSGTDISDGEG